MKNLHTFEEFLNESLNESQSRKTVMDKVAKGLKADVKPLGHKDYLGFDLALRIGVKGDPLYLSISSDGDKLMLYKDNGDVVTSINDYSTKDLRSAIEAINKEIKNR
jgi:hypothetical protein